MGALVSLFRLWKWHFRFGAAWVLMMLLAYAATIAATLAIRFQEWPNYATSYPWLENLSLILSGTPSVTDAIPLLLDEALWEVGYKNPDYYGIAEWSYAFIPMSIAALTLAFILVSTILIYYRHYSLAACPTPSQKALLVGSGGIVSVTSATVSWVVCCATPTWAVFLSLLGFSASLSLQLDPFGSLLFAVGFIFLLVWVVILLRRSTRQSRAQSDSITGRDHSAVRIADTAAPWKMSGEIRHGCQ